MPDNQVDNRLQRSSVPGAEGIESRFEIDQAFEKLKVRDNWQHRSVGMKCATCMWFVEKVPDQGEAKVGRCRKHAPTLNGWPAMKLTDWCGDHKLDEEKIHGNA